MMLSCLEVDEASQLHLYPNQGRHDHLFIKEADCQVITISIQEVIFSEEVIARPAGFLGTKQTDFVANFASSYLGPNIEFETHETPLIPPEKSYPVISIEIRVNASSHQEAVKKSQPLLEKACNSLAAGYSSSIRPFGNVSISEAEGFLNTELPKETGLDWLFPEGGNNFPYEASVAINNALGDDTRLEHLLDLYHQAMGAEHPDLQVSLLYMTLEAIASGINKQMGGNRSKNAILLDLEYCKETLPLFQIENSDPIKVNHIDLACEIRNSFFHGGRDHSNPPNIQIQEALQLYKKAPELLTISLAFDCWKALYLWAQKTSKAHRAWSGENIDLERSVSELNLSYKMHYISREFPAQGVAGVMLRPGEKTGIVYFMFTIRFRRNVIAFQMQVPGGKDPEAAKEFPLGYKLIIQ